MSERMVVITDSWCGNKMACGTVTLKLIFGAFLVRRINDNCMHLYELCGSLLCPCMQDMLCWPFHCTYVCTYPDGVPT